MSREKFYSVQTKNNSLPLFLLVLQIPLLAFVVIKFIKIFQEESDFWGINDLSKIFLGILLLGLSFSLIFRMIKIFRKKEKKEEKRGILINEEGIVDFLSEKEKIGLIAWKDIEQIRIKNNFFGNTQLLLMVKNPVEYINGAKTWETKKKLRIDYRKWGTPAVINIDNLEIKPKDLVKVVKNEFALNGIQNKSE